MYSPDQKQILLDVARKSIACGLETGKALDVKAKDFAAELRETRATFVTLKMAGELRGCIGMLEAMRPLVEDVAENAYAAAFRDPRFNSLTPEEFPGIGISISVLNPAEPMKFVSEEDLLSQIKPGIDGLVLEEGVYRGTFLPAVWESVGTPKEFLEHLKAKVGLPKGYWSKTIRIKRYTTDYIE